MKRFLNNPIPAMLIISIFLFTCSQSVQTDIDLLPEDAQVIVMDKSKIVADDGDSFEYDGTGIRVLGMDTPEISHPEHGFFEDQPFGREAAALTAKIFQEAQSVAYCPTQPDRYGRTLAHVFIDGELLSVKLIKAGLAYETVSHYGDNGFPKIAEKILKVAGESQVKDFIPPFQWRRENRKDPES